jgi:hypothetical protein
MGCVRRVTPVQTIIRAKCETMPRRASNTRAMVGATLVVYSNEGVGPTMRRISLGDQSIEVVDWLFGDNLIPSHSAADHAP